MGRPAAAPTSGHLLALTLLGLAIGPGILVGGSRTRRRLDGPLAALSDTEPGISARAEGVATLTQSPAEAEVAEEEALDQDDPPPTGPVAAGPAASLVAYPAPAPRPAPAPALLPVARPEPAPANASSQDVTQRIKVNNVDYNKLISNPSLLSSFEDALKAQIAAQSGHGVTPDDVDLALSPGSVVVEATVHVPGGSGAAAVQAEACSSSASLGEDVTSALSNLPGMSAVTTGAITSEVTAECGEAAGTTASTARRLEEVASTTQAVIVPSGDQDMDSCNPSCVAGQGVCSDKICFCRSPYTGLRCEREMQASYVRFTYAAAVGIVLAAIVAGLALAVLAFNLAMPTTKLGSRLGSEAMQSMGETWTATEGAR